MIETTSRWAHPYPDLDADPDVPRDIKALAESVDNVAMDYQGLLDDRPTSTVGSPGKPGRYYFATDVGVVFRDTGTSWLPLGAHPESGDALASGDLSLTGTYQALTMDVVGGAVSLTRPFDSACLMTAHVAVEVPKSNTSSCLAYISADGDFGDNRYGAAQGTAGASFDEVWTLSLTRKVTLEAGDATTIRVMVSDSFAKATALQFKCSLGWIVHTEV